MDIEIRTAQKNSEIYRQILRDIKVHDSKRIVNEGDIGYQCDYFTIYYHEGSRCVGIFKVEHCSCYSTEDPETFADADIEIVDTVEDFYEKCLENNLTLEHSEKLCASYIEWFESTQK